MSLAGKPASRKRCAIASAAAVTLPTESVVLISISCLRMSCASLRVAASGGAVCAAIESANNKLAKSTRENRPNHNFRSEEHTSELQSLRHLVCRLLLE